MADRLADNVRRSDTLCHISREIFAVCMPSVSLIDAESIVANLCRAVDVTPFMTPAGPIAPALSVGVVALTAGETAASLIHRADEMHAVKRKRSTHLMAQAAE
jgi:GGDEF domain-containing protein